MRTPKIHTAANKLEWGSTSDTAVRAGPGSNSASTTAVADAATKRPDARTTSHPFHGTPSAVTDSGSVMLTPVRLIVRRVKPTPGSQLALFHTYSYHGFITDRASDTLELEADHRRHAEVENAIRDLNYGVGLNHLLSGRFPANAA